MNVRSLLVLFCGTAVMLAGASDANAGPSTLYRYKDDQGVVAIGATVPPEFVKNGYEVLNANGRVLEVVPRALNPQELAARKAADAEKKRREEVARKRAEEDVLLLRIYGSSEEAARARNRRLQEIDGIISLKRGNLQVLVNQAKDMESQAAQIERSGKPVPEDMHQQIQRIQTNIRGLEQEIAQIQQEKLNAEKEFAAKIERLLYLQELKASKEKSSRDAEG